MTDNYFEGLISLKTRGNTADLAALVDHLATKYLIIWEYRDSPLALTIHVAPPTPRNTLIVKKRAIAQTLRLRKRAKLIFKNRG